MTEEEKVVDRVDVPVMFRRVNDDREAIKRGWAELEEAVGSLKGRKFYGAFYPGDRQYWVCVALQPNDHPEARHLERGNLPGGRYLQVRLRGEPPAVYDLIGPAFTELAQRPDRDPDRPELEFYRSRDVIDLLVPLRD